MTTDSRLDRIEKALDLNDCPECRRAADDLTEENLEEFFLPCPACGRQRTWLDLIDQAEATV